VRVRLLREIVQVGLRDLDAERMDVTFHVLRYLTVPATWIFACLLPPLQEFVRLAGAVQICKAGHLPSDLPDALVQLRVFQIPVLYR
jgi:hypothetical protein